MIKGSKLVPLLLILGIGCDGRQTPVAPDLESGDRHRGVNLVAGRTLPADTFDHILDTNVDWIAQTPFGWQPRFDVPQIKLRPSGVRWGETDEGLRETARRARIHGIKTMLKPHIWLEQEVEVSGAAPFDSSGRRIGSGGKRTIEGLPCTTRAWQPKPAWGCSASGSSFTCPYVSVPCFGADSSTR